MSDDSKPGTAKAARLTALQWRVLTGMCVYAFGTALGYAKHGYDWIGGLFFEVPLVIVSRVLWNSIKIGKDGVELSESPVSELREADRDIAASVNLIENRPTGTVTPSQESEPQIVGGAVAADDEAIEPSSAYIWARWNASEQRASEIEAGFSETDPLLTLARLRIDIERELRRMAQLAGLMKPAQSLTIGILQNLLNRNELLSNDISEPLSRVIRVANGALHGDLSVDSTEQAEVTLLGASIVQNLNKFARSEYWVERAVFVRAQKLGLSIQREYNGPDEWAGLVVNGLRIDVSRPSPLAPQPNTLHIFTDMLPPKPFNHAMRTDSPIVWVSEADFVGTPHAVRLAPWLVTKTVQPN